MNNNTLLDQHNEEGEAIFGELWQQANIGWGAGDDYIITKIYSSPLKFFESTLKDGIVYHKELDSNGQQIGLTIEGY